MAFRKKRDVLQGLNVLEKKSPVKEQVTKDIFLVDKQEKPQRLTFSRVSTGADSLPQTSGRSVAWRLTME